MKDKRRETGKRKEKALSFAVLLVALGFVSVGCASATTIYVPDDYAKIQWAIDNATAGDIIIVKSGTYYENVDVYKQLILRGVNTGGGKPVVDANGSGSAITLSANGITVEGFRATNSGSSYGDAGITVTSNNNIITGNNASSNNYDGICLWYSCNNNIITGNNASNNNWYGIRSCSSNSNNTITGNNACNNNYYGIYLDASSNSTISGNNACNNGDIGIFLVSSSNSTISGNNACNNYDGIYIYASSNITISGNNACNNNYSSIFLWYSCNNNLITGNNASNNYYGIRIGHSNSNILTGNNFINNYDNVHSYGSSNIWNSTEKITYVYNETRYENYMGNYWDDYTGSDADGDRIGDTPYSIDSDADNYPLMVPFEHYFPAEVTPTVSISTDKATYTTGDTMTIIIDITNPTEKSVTFQWYWGVPQFKIWVPVMSVPIPAGYDDTIDFSFTIPDWGSTPFGNVFYVQLLYAGGEVLDADVTWWAYSPSAVETMQVAEVDIAKEIKKTIERVEFPN